MNISTSLCAAAQSLQHVYTDFSFAAFSKFIQYLNCTANSLASARSGGVPENACSRDPIIPFTCSIYITKTQLVLVLHLAIAMNYEETGGSVPLLACRIRSISSGVWASSSSSLASRISARSIGSSILSVSSVPCAFTDNYVHVVKFLLCLEEKREWDEQYTLPSSNHLPKQHTPHSPFRSIPSQGLPRRLPSCCTCLDVIHVDGVPNLNADRLYRLYIRCRVNGPVLVGYRMDRLVIPSWRWGRRGRA